jgi:hypothetical protein
MYIIVGHINGKIIEVFAILGKAGGCGSAVVDGMARMISYGLRSGMEPDRVIKGMSGIQCHQGPDTCCNAIALAVKEVMNELEEMEICEEGYDR